MERNSQGKQRDFSQKMVEILNHSALNVAIAIGYRLLLFETLYEMDGPATCEEIARSAGLNPRYLREWLGVMTTGGVVELHHPPDASPRYFLPREHAAFLCRQAADTNFAVYTQEMPLLTRCAMEPVIEAFATGEGVPYRYYPQFQAFMNELADAKHEKILVGHFLPTVDGGHLVRRLDQGIRVCDVGCGQGVAPLLMAEAFPRSRFVGIDIDPKAIEVCRRSARDRGLDNIEFEVRDAARLQDDAAWHERFQYITAFDAIHDQTAPLDALRGIRRMLTDDGLFSMIDIAAGSDHRDNLDHPMGPFLYAVSLLHCLPVGLVDGGAGLGMMWGRERALGMLREAGFNRIDVLEMDFDPFNWHYQCRKG